MYKSFKEMPIWQDAMGIAERIFRLTDDLPKKEDYGFTSQIRRAALSVSGNIAEAYGRNHKADKMTFYYYARGSVTEVQNHVEYGKRVGYIPEPDAVLLDSTLCGIYNALNRVVLSMKKG